MSKEADDSPGLARLAGRYQEEWTDVSRLLVGPAIIY